VFSCYFAYFIIEQSYNTNSILKFGRIPLFNYLGKISYGMYCFHGIVITILIKGLNYFNYKEKLIDSLVLYPLIVFCVTLLISVLSFKYFESWFLRKKKKFY
jgi:peptidoglycan/LPS O-acetylase OafA/YrhL